MIATLSLVSCTKDENVVRVNEVTHSVFYAPLYVAINEGFFEEE
jgi:NitT/TauT family transport system substrate-binding protein